MRACRRTTVVDIRNQVAHHLPDRDFLVVNAEDVDSADVDVFHVYDSEKHGQVRVADLQLYTVMAIKLEWMVREYLRGH